MKEVSDAKGGNVESCSRVKDGNRRLVQGEDGARKLKNRKAAGKYEITVELIGLLWPQAFQF